MGKTDLEALKRPKRKPTALVITPAAEAILQNLALYRLLTIPQLLGMGIASRNHISDQLRILRNAGWIQSLDVFRGDGPGLHWLTAKGAREAEALGLVSLGRKAHFLQRPYRGGHKIQRAAIVDVHIALRAWAAKSGFSIDWFKTEFEGHFSAGDGQLAAVTQTIWEGSRYTPDGLGQITGPDGKTWLFALEVETGGKYRTLDNHRAKLPERLRVVQNFEVERALKWSHEESMRLLFVFRDDVMLKDAKTMLVSPQAEAWQSVYFKSLPEVIADFGGKWWTSTGQPKAPFGK